MTVTEPAVQSDRPQPPDFLAGGGEMGALVRTKNWAATPLGAVEGWSTSLRAAVDLILPNRFPMVILWGREFVQIYNDGYRLIMADKHPAGLGQRTKECWPEIWHINAPIYERVWKGETLTFEDALYPITRHGPLEEAWFDLCYSPMRDDAGEIAGVLVTVVEVTHRHLAEINRNHADAVLRESEQRTRELFQQAPGFMCILRGPDHVFEFANDSYLRLVGGRDLVGKPAREALPEVEPQGFLSVLDRVYRTGEPYRAIETPVRLQRSAGEALEQRFVSFIYQPIRDAQGAVTGIFVEGFDVTDRVRAQAALRESQARSEQQRRLYEAILTNTPDLAYVFDLNHRFIYANDVLLRMWGKSWDEALGRNCLELGYEPWHAAMHDREIEQVIATKQPIRGEVPFTGTFGRRTYDYIFVPVIGPDGEVEAVAGTTRDVTDRKQTIDDLNALKNDLASQLADMQRLYAFSRRTLDRDDLDAVMRDLLLAVTDLMQVEKGTVQLCDPSRRGLRLISTVGFDRDFEEQFQFVEASGFTSCAAALNRRDRVIVEDLAANPDFARLAQAVAPYGIRAVQSTPLLDKDGVVIAMLTTYSDRPYRPSNRQLQVMDLYLEVTARQIERKQASDELARSEVRLAAELAAARQLQAISTVLIQEGDIAALYRQLVHAAMAVMRSDAASIQVLDRQRGELRLLDWQGFHPQSAAFWEWVRLDSGSTCGRAFHVGGRVVATDVEACDFMAGTPDLDECRRSGIRAVQSTPLISRFGQLLGMISTHWRDAHAPTEADLRLLDVLARQAADLIERAESQRRLEESEAQLRLAIDAADIGLWDVDPVNDRLYWPPRVKAMFGISADVPVSMADFYAGLHPDDREATSAAFAATVDPEQRAPYDVEYRTIGKEDGVTRWVAAKGRGIFDGSDTCIRVIGTAIDITVRKRHEERQKLLLNELDHRVKNTLATVQSFAMQTLRNAASLADGRAAFDARLIALSKAHDVLVREHWEGAALHEVVSGAVAAYSGNGRETRVRFAGPEIRLQPKAALAISMALHELATNAVKYGALSNATGQVTIGWHIYDLQDFELRWTEAGGPLVGAPRRRGFGSRLIEQGLAQDLGGKVKLAFEREGLICSIKAPLDEIRGALAKQFDADARAAIGSDTR